MISSTYILLPNSKLTIHVPNLTNGIDTFIFNYSTPTDCVTATRHVMQRIVECIGHPSDPSYELEFAKFVHNQLVVMWHKQQETSFEGGELE